MEPLRNEPKPTTFTESMKKLEKSQPAKHTAPMPKRRPNISLKTFKLPVAIALAIILVAVSGVYHLSHKPKPTNDIKSVLAESTQNQTTIPIFVPSALPKGYKYNNDFKQIKNDIYYFSVSGPSGKKFYITQQPIPAKFDFVGFNNKFLNPDNFNTDAGTVTAGPSGADLLASLRTTKNTWIIVNAQDTSPANLSQLESVVRSLHPQ